MFKPTEEYKRSVLAWRDAAVADGWLIKPTYPKHEDQERASTLEREGFKVSVLSREPRPDGKSWEGKNPEYSLYAWGPDDLVISLPMPYSWELVKAAACVCMDCKKKVEKTLRVGFAGRVCAACLPAAKARDEKPGWCD